MLRADLEPQLRLGGRDHDGGELRGRGSRPLLRSRRRAARRGRQPPDADLAAAAMEAPAGDDADTLKDAQVRGVPRDARGRPRALRPRPVRRLPRHRRRRAGVDDRDVRGAAARDRQLAVGRRSVLHPHRASACRSPRPSCGWCSAVRRGSASSRRSGTARRSRASS